ncbi:hypothetical protein GCM10011339_44380 [Echinicola rosea]|uniref:Uncharacterized protein n=2 Tax=Echinicola rosea TaxID=1807691 RepID=A0ABQ1VBQ0_9BACT|nr:hypothetical protein GCM10011339_44380 [Echinicola rosea]
MGVDSLAVGKPQPTQRNLKKTHLYSSNRSVMSTPVHVSKKLEKLIKKQITPTSSTESTGILGKWSATIFYINLTVTGPFPHAGN